MTQFIINIGTVKNYLLILFCCIAIDGESQFQRAISPILPNDSLLVVTVFFDYLQSDSLISSGLHQKFMFDPNLKKLTASLYYKKDTLFQAIEYRYDSLGKYSQILYWGDYSADYVFSYNGDTCLIGDPDNPEYKIEIQRQGGSIVRKIYEMKEQSKTKVFAVFSNDPYPQWFTVYKKSIQFNNKSEKRTEYYGYFDRLELTEEPIEWLNFLLEYESGDSVVFDLNGIPVFRKSSNYDVSYFFTRSYLRQVLYVGEDNKLRLRYHYEFERNGRH